MFFIRGANGLFPCPICLVPKDQLKMIWREFEKCTGAKAKELLAQAREAPTAKKSEEILKNWSLRDIDVCIWYYLALEDIAYIFVLECLLWDKLYWSLWGSIIWLPTCIPWRTLWASYLAFTESTYWEALSSWGSTSWCTVRHLYSYSLIRL